ncbi:MAG TPA: carbonate dehydratase [Gammaproteobacteria bacterium]|nr:carbonate dehydratase [Gammaproteobacteria bacterium]
MADLKTTGRAVDLDPLFDNNRRWAADKLAEDPEFFSRLTAQQAPDYLWIGCSDSRVPANEIIGLAPGEVFVHRNVANLVLHSDMNCLSVLQYAVEVLQVRHIIVCGHYGCGGVKTAVEPRSCGLISNWLRPIRELADARAAELAELGDEVARSNRLCELNVMRQVENVANTTIVQDAWHLGQALAIHGLCYGIGDGLLRDLGVTVGSS